MRANRAAQPDELPWTLPELSSLSLMYGGGVIAVVIAWFGASGETRAAGQMVWLNVGIGGTIVACGAVGVWIAAGRRAIGARRQLLLDAIGRALPRGIAEGTSPPVELVAGPSMTKFHVRDCRLALDKTVTASTESQHKRAGRLPCAVCQPQPCKESSP